MPTDEAARERGRRWLAAGFDPERYGVTMRQEYRYTGANGEQVDSPSLYRWSGDQGWTMRPDDPDYGACDPADVPPFPPGTESGTWVSDLWPDDRDDATLGVMVAQTRERWGLPLWAEPLTTGLPDGPPGGDQWLVKAPIHYGEVVADGPTEAEAWLAAFEAGPR